MKMTDIIKNKIAMVYYDCCGCCDILLYYDINTIMQYSDYCKYCDILQY